MSSHEVTPRGHAHGYSSRLVTGRCIGPESQPVQFPVTMTPGGQLDWWPSKPATDQQGTLIKGILGQ